MSDVMTQPWDRPLTADDFFAMDTPDDGDRYELIDGVLIVSPSPFVQHQSVQMQLIACMLPACPSDMRLFAAPLDVTLSTGTVVEPDLVVVRAEDATAKRLSGVPLLTVEILSDYHRATDLLLKRSRYERAGIPSYWIVDPISLEIKVLELGPDGALVEVVHADLEAAPLAVQRPFPVTLRLSH